MSEETVGGQAVIEGVMMRRGNRMAIAVRDRDTVTVREEAWEKIDNPVRNWPLLRGFFALIESMFNGVRAIRWSASIAEGKETEFGKIPDWYLPLALFLTFAIFMVLPQYLVVGAGMLGGLDVTGDSALFHVAVGFSKVFVFAAYLWLLGKTSDGSRLYGFHGAEHKVVNCFEAGENLTISNAMRHSRIHTRCGTTFLFIAIIFSALTFTIAFPLIGIASQWLVVLLKFLMLPLIAGVSFELLMKFGKHLPPALWMQKLTTREPTRHQVEAAIFALKAVMPRSSKHTREAHSQ